MRKSDRPLYTVEFSDHAAKSLARLPNRMFERISSAVDALEMNPRPHGCKKLEGAIDPQRQQLPPRQVRSQTPIAAPVLHNSTVDNGTGSASVI